MTKTPPITLEWINGKESKLQAYKISADALALINKSETLKSDIRAYAASDYVDPGKIHIEAGTGAFTTYRPATTSSATKNGFLEIAADRFGTPESTFNVLAHELGHFRTEEPGAAIANARANASVKKDMAAYANACNLAEGYAKYNEVKARAEVLAENRAQAEAKKEQLSSDELRLENRWSGTGIYEAFPESKDHNIVKSIKSAAGAYGRLLTPQEITDAAAFALGENNKSNTTSTTKETYLEFCEKSAKAVLASGATPAAAYGQEQLETIYNTDGSVASRSVTVSSSNSDKIATEFDASGRTSRVIETDGARDNADYAVRTTAFDAEGREDWQSSARDDGGEQWRDIDQKGERADRVFERLTDAQGRHDWFLFTQDSGEVHWTDFDQKGEREDRYRESRIDAQGRQDWSRFTRDDGAVHWIDADQKNERADRTFESFTDAQGRHDWTQITQDSGAVHWIDLDQKNERGDRTFESFTDAQGRHDWTQITQDDGAVHWIDLDQRNERGDRTWESFTDAQGRQDWYRVVQDSGGIHWTDLDQKNERGDRIWESFTDSQGRQDWCNITQDDGTRDWIDYDQDNTHGWSRIDTKFNSWGLQDYANRCFDDGSRLFIDYDHYGVGKHQLVGYNAWGQSVFIGSMVKNVVVGVTGKWSPIFGEGLGLNHVMAPGGGVPIPPSPFPSLPQFPGSNPYDGAITFPVPDRDINGTPLPPLPPLL